MADTPAGFVRIDEAHLRVADISYMKWDRGHSYTALDITMRDGKTFRVTDFRGSAYAAEKAIIDASAKESAHG